MSNAVKLSQHLLFISRFVHYILPLTGIRLSKCCSNVCFSQHLRVCLYVFLNTVELGIVLAFAS